MKNYFKLLPVLAVAAGLLAIPEMAFAQPAALGNKIANVICNIVNVLDSGVVAALASVMVVVIVLMAFGGQFQIKEAIKWAALIVVLASVPIVANILVAKSCDKGAAATIDSFGGGS